MNVSIIVAHLTLGPSPLVVHLMRDIDHRKEIENLTEEIMVRVGQLTHRQADDIVRKAPSRNLPAVLTPREISVLQMLSLGRSTLQIAAELHISTSTVRNHIQHIFGKLRSHTRLEAVIRAVRQGLI